MPPAIPGLGTPRFNIGKQMQSQASNLLRQGVGGSGEKFDKIRQRHLWSAYAFHAATGGAISTAGVLAASDYPIFTTPIGQNGQGYPSGLSLSLRDTNMPGVQRISDNQNFAIWEMGLNAMPHRDDVVSQSTANMAPGAVEPSDLELWGSNVVLQIVYLTNRVTLGHMHDFCQPAGPTMAAPTLLDFAGNQNVAGNGGGLGEGAGATPWDGRQARISNNAGSIPPAPALRRKFRVPIFFKSGDTFSFIYSVPRPVQLRTVAQGGTGGCALRLDWWAVESFREQG